MEMHMRKRDAIVLAVLAGFILLHAGALRQGGAGQSEDADVYRQHA